MLAEARGLWGSTEEVYAQLEAEESPTPPTFAQSSDEADMSMAAEQAVVNEPTVEQQQLEWLQQQQPRLQPQLQQQPQQQPQLQQQQPSLQPQVPADIDPSSIPVPEDDMDAEAEGWVKPHPPLPKKWAKYDQDLAQRAWDEASTTWVEIDWTGHQWWYLVPGSDPEIWFEDGWSVTDWAAWTVYRRLKKEKEAEEQQKASASSSSMVVEQQQQPQQLPACSSRSRNSISRSRSPVPKRCNSISRSRSPCPKRFRVFEAFQQDLNREIAAITEADSQEPAEPIDPEVQ